MVLWQFLSALDEATEKQKARTRLEASRAEQGVTVQRLNGNEGSANGQKMAPHL